MPSPKTPTKYEGPNVYTGTVVIRNRRPTLADYRQPETGKNYEIACVWEVGVDPTTGTYGELWMLQKIVANQGYWIMLSSGVIPPAGPVLSLSDTADTLVFPETIGNVGNIQLEATAGITITSDPGNHKLVFALAGGGTAIDQIQVQALTAPGVNPVDPTGLGLMTVNGAVVAAHAVPLETRTRALNTWNIEVQVASEQAASSINNAGVASFSNAQFDVDASGYVTLIGSVGPAATKFDVQSATAPGVDPVTPSAAGVVSVNGAAVAAHGVPLESHTRALNAYNLEVQFASEQVASDADDAGIASFNSAQFDVDVVGFVSLLGGTGPTVLTTTGDDAVAVGPSGTGTIHIIGNTVANATHAKPLFVVNSAANTERIDVQVAIAVTPTPANTNLAGIASYNTNHFTVDATSAMVSLKSSMINGPLGDSYNLGINYSSPTFKLTSSSGTALSATNLAFVVIPSNVSKGYKIVLPVSADITFQDDSGTSVLTGNLWGTTTAVAWPSAMPFYLYAVADAADANVTFMISRVPHLTTTPAAGKIAKSGSPVASTQGSMFAIDSTVTVANYATKACVRIGAFQMAKNDAANNDWTVQTMTDSDGIGRTLEEIFFSFPNNQNGAVRGGLSSSVGGDTIPTANQQGLNYRMEVSGLCYYAWNVDFYNIAGVGAGNIRWHLPLVCAYDTSFIALPQGASHQNLAAGTFNTLAIRSAVTTPIYMDLLPTGTGVALLTPAYFTTDLLHIAIDITYPVSII